MSVSTTSRKRRPTGRDARGALGAPRAVYHLDTCHAALGSDRSTSVILGVSPSQISRWRRGQVPDIENADRLAGLALVIEMLSRWLDPEAVGGWLHGIHAHLEDRSPVYMIGQGRVANVIGAIEAEKAGGFA